MPKELELRFLTGFQGKIVTLKERLCRCQFIQVVKLSITSNNTL